jgi:hypothetical protein
MNSVNKYLFLFFVWNSALYSSELAEYCYVMHSEDNRCLELSTSDSSIITKIEESDSLKCYEYEHEHKHIIYLSENLIANKRNGYEARGCLSTGGALGYDFNSVRCSMMIKLDIPVTFPKKISICEQIKSINIKSLLEKTLPAEWQLETKCDSFDTTYSGKYFIRITGECK